MWGPVMLNWLHWPLAGLGYYLYLMFDEGDLLFVGKFEELPTIGLLIKCANYASIT
jgi:hypothetical protein